MKKVYLAIPYSGMEESSYHQATKATAKFMNDGINVFSPITHSHPLHKEYNMPGTWNFWQKVDYQYLDWADEVYVIVPEEGYDKVLNSTGVQAEMAYAKHQDKPVTILRLEQNGEYRKFDKSGIEV